MRDGSGGQPRQGGSPPITKVSGGAYGIEATYESMESFARRVDTTGSALRERSSLGSCAAGDLDLVASGVLAPISFARAEAMLLRASIGPDGLLAQALGVELDSMIVGEVTSIYRSTDDLVAGLYEQGSWVTGALLIAPFGPLGGLLAGAPLYLAEKATGGAVSRGLAGWVRRHPEGAQFLLNGTGGVVDGFAPFSLVSTAAGNRSLDGIQTDNVEAAGLLAGLFGREGLPQVTRPALNDELTPLVVPRSVADLLANLRTVDKQEESIAGKDRQDGLIEVQRLEGADGPVFVVYVPGTDEFTVGTDRATDGHADASAAGRRQTAYERGIREALRRAGALGHRVILVGHSLGGMVATSLAADPGFGRDYRVSQVITAGSPVAQVPDLPAHTQALHLENAGDAIPLTDGEENPDASNRLTVRFDHGPGGLAEQHGMDRYEDGARSVDRSADPSIRDFRDGLFGGGWPPEDAPSTQKEWQIRRRPD